MGGGKLSALGVRDPQGCFAVNLGVEEVIIRGNEVQRADEVTLWHNRMSVGKIEHRQEFWSLPRLVSGFGKNMHGDKASIQNMCLEN